MRSPAAMRPWSAMARPRSRRMRRWSVGRSASSAVGAGRAGGHGVEARWVGDAGPRLRGVVALRAQHDLSRFPEVARISEAASQQAQEGAAGYDDEFAFGLDLVLDGLETRLLREQGVVARSASVQHPADGSHAVVAPPLRSAPGMRFWAAPGPRGLAAPFAGKLPRALRWRPCGRCASGCDRGDPGCARAHPLRRGDQHGCCRRCAVRRRSRR
jgi:hypothetical protein